MRGDAFADARPVCGIVAGDPESCPRWVNPAPGGRCGKQIHPRLAPAPVLAQRLQQGRTQRQITILATLAFHHAMDHALAIDVADLEAGDFAAPQARAIEGHQQALRNRFPLASIRRGTFFLAEDAGQPFVHSPVRKKISELRALQCTYLRRTFSEVLDNLGLELRTDQAYGVGSYPGE